MKKILIPTDFSDNAWNAIGYALEFFKKDRCTFFILHTYTPNFYRVDYLLGGPTYSAIPDKKVDLAQAGLDKTLVEIKLKYPNKNHAFKTLSAFNTLTDEITEFTEREDIDLIVMGTQGATGAKEIFLGTHTVHVIRKSKVPVLVIPSSYTFKEIKSIVFPTDYANPFNEKELQFLTYVAKLHDAKLTVLNVKDDYVLNDDQKANKKSLSVIFSNLKHTFDQVKGEEMPKSIHQYIDQQKSVLLVMMGRKHSFLERLIVTSNVDSIGYHTNIPFLIIPETQKIVPKKINS